MAAPKETPLENLACALASGKELADRLLKPTPRELARRPELADLPLRAEWERIRGTFDLCWLLAQDVREQPPRR